MKSNSSSGEELRELYEMLCESSASDAVGAVEIEKPSGEEPHSEGDAGASPVLAETDVGVFPAIFPATRLISHTKETVGLRQRRLAGAGLVAALGSCKRWFCLFRRMLGVQATS